ncbi:aminotransferase class V-fold PLP-dependent enzyme [Winogradskyella immobilis]|uniref:Aminotransferase class V-fold PLP-dependent enzyme n=1 Tax=Winogradskyella immobilis TaxID=2816852 RepID=A0ABS8EQC6_9FLAO|nr:aminotransferase class V-fold PLP-dependent enzyme [Winogradskyella immobilis]MCC1485383.1 aminotransferase class V-fold PLP-dependent enzyme [Winogradskyella immobilis]MCG0017475.1 aminotransferase class V-fold PLP-dependent enzyme [Winogradskyella immobilis]
MPLQQQKHLFDIPEDICYLNTANLSPSFKSVETAGITSVLEKSRPYKITGYHFFDAVTELKKEFAKVINAKDYNRIATIPSVSYGLANAAENITLQKGDEIIIVEEQFPSNYYVWKKIADRYGASIVTIKQPEDREHCGDLWNEAILEAITEKTALVTLGNIHWANGLVFDLKAIRQKSRQHNALLIVDGSQSIGALPFDVNDIQPDALVCAGYKWLFGPYGCAYAYYGSYFDNGIPFEENWSNRLGSENITGLTHYQPEYKPLANRYNVGESGNFINVSMQIEGIKQVSQFSPKDIQTYCHSITKDAVKELKDIGFYVNKDEQRAKHLFGIEIPKSIDGEQLRMALAEQNIYVSFRGNYIRLSCHVLNTKADFDKLLRCIKSVMTLV